MKKTFTLAMAAMISLSALAITPKTSFTPTLKQMPATLTELPAALKQHKAISRAEEEGPTFHDGVNTADILTFNFYYHSQEFAPILTSYQREIVIDLANGTFELPYFLGIDCTLKGNFVETAEGDLKLEIPFGQKLTTYQQYDIVFIALNPAIEDGEILFEGNLPVIVGDNIMQSEVMYDAEGQAGAWYLYAAAVLDGEVAGVFAGCGNLNICLPNSSFEFDWTDTKGNTAEFVTDRYVEMYYDENENLYVTTPFCQVMGEYPMDEYAMATGSVDDYGYMIFEDQLAYSTYSQDNGGYLDFYLCTYLEGTGPVATTLEGQASNEGVLSFEGWSNCTSLTGDYFTFGSSSYMNINLGKLSGIEDIKADTADNSNAPVEYFNLQGMRIANPAAGQIVIRRQGTEATKLFVK
ncbi:MAG: hypothetical protein HUK14_11295 [Muribaculaceae bacterium]|nr:hypothetical protein [Muribaculaceae bacterium]